MLLPVVCNTEISKNHDAASELKASSESSQVPAIKVEVDRISATASVTAPKMPLKRLRQVSLLTKVPSFCYSRKWNLVSARRRRSTTHLSGIQAVTEVAEAL